MAQDEVVIANFKRGKKKQLVGMLLVLLSMATCTVGAVGGHGLGMGTFMAVFGIVLWVYGSFEHWYHAK